MPNTEEDELLCCLFARGYPYKDIIVLLKSVFDCQLSERQLHRRLRKLNRRRKSVAQPDTVVASYIADEVDLHGNYKGYRQMTTVLRQQYGVSCTRAQVQHLLRCHDPIAAQARKCNRLKRRQYVCDGPSALWHMDGFDKLKQFGFPVHGCIDGYSRKVLWLKCDYSNNDPKIIGGYFLQCVKEVHHVPAKLRTDCGTENGVAASMQSFFHQDERAHIYGKSTSNQRIEALWSKFRPAIQGWLDFFKNLTEQGIFTPGNTVQVHVIRWVFQSMIRQTLDAFKLYWNTHYIAQCGIPDVLFYTHQSCGMQPQEIHLTECEQACHAETSRTGDADVDEYIQYIMNELQLQEAQTKEQGLDLYRTILSAAE